MMIAMCRSQGIAGPLRVRPPARRGRQPRLGRGPRPATAARWPTTRRTPARPTCATSRSPSAATTATSRRRPARYRVGPSRHADGAQAGRHHVRALTVIEQVLHSLIERAYDLAHDRRRHADDIEDRLAVVVGQLNALHAQLVDLVAEARDTNAWAGLGIRSLTHWLTWKAGVSNQHAAALVRLADARARTPSSRALFADGRLTVDQAAVAVKVARPPRSPGRRDGAAGHGQPAAHHRPLLPAGRTPADPPTPPADRDTVSTWTNDDGRYHLSRRPRRRPRPHRRRRPPRRPRPPPAATAARRVTWIDALARRRRPLPRRRAPRPPRALPDQRLPRPDRRRSRPRWPDGTTAPRRHPRPPHVRRHARRPCSPTTATRSRSAARSASSRTAPAASSCTATRPAASRGAAPAATSTSTTSSTGSHGGRTDYDNLIALCRRCHRAHHHGELGITRRPARARRPGVHRPPRPDHHRPAPGGAADRTATRAPAPVRARARRAAGHPQRRRRVHRPAPARPTLRGRRLSASSVERR